MTQWPFLDDNDAKCLSRDSFFLIPNKVDSCFWENFVVFFIVFAPFVIHPKLVMNSTICWNVPTHHFLI